ncbi:hypothetical protein P4654_27025 [Niallia taxi]|uniref:hypothetical protein n=1 Tax=Niallia taxi TaxID=2499688 RepID=UPI002E21C2AD|nr:hypothetical protein [Niallia taxi]MED4122284.1 hypothetical protein [Niallia taxi]
MKGNKKDIIDFVMYSVLLIFFTWWFIKDDVPNAYLWAMVLIYSVMIVFKIRKIFFSRKESV